MISLPVVVADQGSLSHHQHGRGRMQIPVILALTPADRPSASTSVEGAPAKTAARVRQRRIRPLSAQAAQRADTQGHSLTSVPHVALASTSPRLVAPRAPLAPAQMATILRMIRTRPWGATRAGTANRFTTPTTRQMVITTVVASVTLAST